MKLGILLAGKKPEDIAQRLALAREAGFSLCQLNLHQHGLTRGDMIAISESMAEHGVRPVAIGCYVNPLHPAATTGMGVARADLDLVLSCLDILGARRVVFFSGSHCETAFGEHPDNAGEEALKTLVDFLKDVVTSTRARHYTLVLEPWRTHVLSDDLHVSDFHRRLPAAVAEKVRYVLDATSLITPDRYATRDARARSICASLGELAGVVHLKDLIMPPDGEESFTGPGQGRLDYERYVEHLQQFAAADAPAVIRNVPPDEWMDRRDYLLRLSDRWELA